MPLDKAQISHIPKLNSCQQQLVPSVVCGIFPLYAEIFFYIFLINDRIFRVWTLNLGNGWGFVRLLKRSWGDFGLSHCIVQRVLGVDLCLQQTGMYLLIV